MNIDMGLSDFTELFVTHCGPEIAEKYLKNQDLMAYLNSGGFFTAPASTKYHGAHEGGLFEHSLAVATTLCDLTEKMGLKWRRVESPFIVGMFHDVCKCDQYTFTPSGQAGEPGYYEYNPFTMLKGHGSKSVMILSQFINLTEEEMLCIRYHMGAYEKEDWVELDLAIKKYPNVLWTHTADMYTSKVLGV